MKEAKTLRAARRPRYGRTACPLWDEKQLAGAVFEHPREHFLSSYRAGTLDDCYTGQRASAQGPHGVASHGGNAIYAAPMEEPRGAQKLSDKRRAIAAERLKEWEDSDSRPWLIRSPARDGISMTRAKTSLFHVHEGDQNYEGYTAAWCYEFPGGEIVPDGPSGIPPHIPEPIEGPAPSADDPGPQPDEPVRTANPHPKKKAPKKEEARRPRRKKPPVVSQEELSEEEPVPEAEHRPSAGARKKLERKADQIVVIQRRLEQAKGRGSEVRERYRQRQERMERASAVPLDWEPEYMRKIPPRSVERSKRWIRTGVSALNQA